MMNKSQQFIEKLVKYAVDEKTLKEIAETIERLKASGKEIDTPSDVVQADVQVAKESKVNKSKAFLNRLNEFNSMIPIEIDSIKKAFEKRIEELDLDKLFVEEVKADGDGDLIVTFSDGSEDFMELLFYVDETDRVLALVIDEDEDELTEIDLSATGVSTLKGLFANFVNLGELSWVTSSIMKTLLSFNHEDEVEERGYSGPKIGEFVSHKDFEKTGKIVAKNDDTVFVEFEKDDCPLILPMYITDLSNGRNDKYIDEQRKVTVVRGGKRERLPVVRKRHRRRLTPKERAGIRKGVKTRRSKKSQSDRKRKRSLRVRKRLKLKKSNVDKKKFRVSR